MTKEGRRQSSCYPSWTHYWIRYLHFGTVVEGTTKALRHLQDTLHQQVSIGSIACCSLTLWRNLYLEYFPRNPYFGCLNTWFLRGENNVWRTFMIQAKGADNENTENFTSSSSKHPTLVKPDFPDHQKNHVDSPLERRGGDLESLQGKRGCTVPTQPFRRRNKRWKRFWFPGGNLFYPAKVRQFPSRNQSPACSKEQASSLHEPPTTTQ